MSEISSKFLRNFSIKLFKFPFSESPFFKNCLEEKFGVIMLNTLYSWEEILSCVKKHCKKTGNILGNLKKISVEFLGNFEKIFGRISYHKTSG